MSGNPALGSAPAPAPAPAAASAPPPANPTLRRRWLGLGLAIGCAMGLAKIHHWATDFPVERPILRVDEALVERLRGEPGLHLALAPDFVLAVSLDLAEDVQSRRLFATEVDLREQGRPDRAIHIQRKGRRAAIHADRYNPAAGLWPRFLHGTIEVPAIPLALGVVVGLGVAAWPARRRQGG